VLQTPPARACLAQTIVNSSNTAGWTAQTAVQAPNRSVASPQVRVHLLIPHP
jgi:hypothetical protein